jgi:hypothetical protein
MSILKNILTVTIASLTLTLTACGGGDDKTTYVDVPGPETTIIETVEVEKQPFKFSASLSAFGFAAQDNLEVVINDGEIPDSIHLKYVKATFRYLDENNRWLKPTTVEVNLDQDTFTVNLYESGSYAVNIQASHYSTNGDNSHSELFYTNVIIEDIQEDKHVNAVLLPFISEEEYTDIQFTGERTATVFDYMTHGNKICYKSENNYFNDMFYLREDSQYDSFRLLCNTEATLTKMQLGMTDEVIFSLPNENYDYIDYPGSSDINLDFALRAGNNYINYKVKESENTDTLNIIINSLTIDTSADQQVIYEIVNNTKYIVEHPEFYVPDTNEVILTAIYGSINVDDICLNKETFRVNGEDVAYDYYSSDLNAYCFKPTGLEGQNVRLDIFPRTEVDTWRGWIFESDEVGLKIVYAKGHSPYTNSDGENPVIEWTAE